MMVLKERLSAVLHQKWSIFGLILLLPVILGLLAAAVDFGCHRGKIYPGVYLQEIPLGRLSLVAAEDRLNSGLFSLEQITLTGAGLEPRTIPLGRLGIGYDREKTMDALRRAGTGCSGYSGRLSRLFGGAPLHLNGELIVQSSRLEQALEQLAGELERAPQEPALIVRGPNVFIEEGREGRFLKKEQLRRELPEAILRGQQELPLPLGTRAPQQSAAELAALGLEQVMVSFSTTVSPTLPGRTNNIRLGAAAINGCLIAPGEIFSFGAIIGETTREKGYQEAPVIVGGELRPGLGGGLCQVSSTLYNAALLANLEIVERHNHSLVVNYLPVGRDATISIGWADLKFRNSREHHLLIGAELSDGLLTFRFFGPPMEERVEITSSDIVRIAPPVRYETDPSLPPGETELVQSGAPGYTVKTWRVLYRGEKKISRELLSHDHYNPTTAIYRTGPDPFGSKLGPAAEKHWRLSAARAARVHP